MKKLVINKELTAEYRELRKVANSGETWKVAGLPQFKGRIVEPRKLYGKSVWYVYDKV